MKFYLAIDIGASSGRHIIGWQEDGEIRMDEVYRFPNGMETRDGHLVWDTEALLAQVKEGIDRALAKYPQIESLSVDTWGVDYVLMQGEKEILPCYAYRDSRTQRSIPQVHARIPFEELYRRTGIQFQTFNTIYQLYEDQMSGRLAQADDFLLMPEYILYKLCGVRGHEYTEATTGGMVSAKTGEYDPEMIRQLGLPQKLFKPLDRPGRFLGMYRGIRCVLCATHDTGSAVEGMPMTEDDLFLSSGTWSLLGARIPSPLTDENSCRTNWSNEGGVGYIRYLKNIMGMWIVNRLREELCPDTPFAEITAMAEQSSFAGLVDVNDGDFMAPESMSGTMAAKLAVKPETPADYFRCAYCSLARCYRDAIAQVQKNTGKRYRRLVIVGGGAKNAFLNRLTAEAAGLEVVPLPIEATAIGNLLVQMKAGQ